MAQTGISIKVADTVLGRPIDVNSTTLFVFSPETGSARDEFYATSFFRSFSSYEEYRSIMTGSWTNDNELEYPELVAGRLFFNPSKSIDNTGVKLWVYAAYETDPAPIADLISIVRKTVADGFENRPRTVVYFPRESEDIDEVVRTMEDAFSTLRTEGFNLVGLVALASENYEDADQLVNNMWAESGRPDTPFVSVVANSIKWPPVESEYREKSFYSAAPIVAGYLSAISVGTSIGDMTLPPIGHPLRLATVIPNSANDWKDNYDNVVLANLKLLSDSQLIFARTRPPRNGLWWNDGSTLNSPDNALSTLEACRTICSIVDDLRDYFTSYINTRVPVTSSGDIQPAYKSVVLSNARAKVIAPYIENGDISDARIELVAKSNDMVGTRTWEVKLSILPAPTLRWIDGFVFYVNSL